MHLLEKHFNIGIAAGLIIIIISLPQSTAGHRPLHVSPSRSIFGHSHPAPASRPAQIFTPPGLRASYTTFTETVFTPELVYLSGYRFYG
jgi:hypothetical protein